MNEVREVIQAQIDRLQAALAALDGNTASHTKIARCEPHGKIGCGTCFFNDTRGNGVLEQHKRNAVLHHRKRRKGGHIQICKGCGKKFVAYDPRQLFHNRRCLSAYHTKNRDMGIKKCTFDGEPFKATRKGQKYCSKSHAMKHRVQLESTKK